METGLATKTNGKVAHAFPTLKMVASKKRNRALGDIPEVLVPTITNKIIVNNRCCNLFLKLIETYEILTICIKMIQPSRGKSPRKSPPLVGK